MAKKAATKRTAGTEDLSLRFDPDNTNRHSDRSLEAVLDSVDELGAGRSIVVDKTGQVIGGEATLKAAQELGLKTRQIRTKGDELIVVVREDLGPDDPRRLALSIADNRTAQFGELDINAVAEHIGSLAEHSQAIADACGFAAEEMEEALASFEPFDESGNGEIDEVEPQIDRAEELQKEWGTERDQLWEIPGKAGVHRILCGDSTNAEDVERLMDGQKAGLMNTDPPYGVAYANDERPNPGVAKPRVAKDELCDEELQSFLEKVFQAAVNIALRQDAAWYLWHAHLTQGFFAAAAAAAANVVLHRQIIWVKPVLLLTRGQYHWKHEPCFMGWVKGHQPPDYGEGNGERTQTTVWEIESVSQADRKEYNHSTPKPVGLFTIPVVKHLKQGEICYEPFAGSGPQFVGAEQLGRICYGIEIEPKYVAVCLQRMKDMGLEPRQLA